MSLKNLRHEIDTTDTKIVRLLNRRAGIATRIADFKFRHGQSRYSPEREREVLRKLRRINKGPLNSRALEAIYREIMSAALCFKRPLSVAYLGPQATFTHLAALKRFGSQVEYLAVDGIAEVFLEVERGGADYGVVPIENSIEGAVSHTLDLLIDSDLNICSQIILDVTHNLMANCPRNKIRRVYSKPEVFGQCRLWLKENLPGIETVEVSSTTRAAQIAAREKYAAAIASTVAARVYKLKIVASNIEDSPHNITRFLVIGKDEAAATGDDKTSLVFSIKDKVGALCEMLAPFKKYRINLTKIESRPSKRKAWDYYFFVDLEGHRSDPKVRKALVELENKCRFIKVLGSYPVGE